MIHWRQHWKVTKQKCALFWHCGFLSPKCLVQVFGGFLEIWPHSPIVCCPCFSFWATEFLLKHQVDGFWKNLGGEVFYLYMLTNHSDLLSNFKKKGVPQQSLCWSACCTSSCGINKNQSAKMGDRMGPVCQGQCHWFTTRTRFPWRSGVVTQWWHHSRNVNQKVWVWEGNPLKILRLYPSFIGNWRHFGLEGGLMVEQ